MKFEKIVHIRPPYDKRNKDPKKNYGIGSMDIWFILKKGENAVQVLISTNSYLQSVMNEKGHLMDSGDYEGYSCYDVGYHACKPQYEGQQAMDCTILKKGKCYYDGSSLRGTTEEVAKNFIEHGTDWVWKYLEKEWNVRFGHKLKLEIKNLSDYDALQEKKKNAEGTESPKD